jgi:PKD repeat protein
MKKAQIAPLMLLACTAVQAQLSYPFPQMVPDEFMEPGFHESVDRDTFPAALTDARETYIQMIDANQANADALFESRTFTGSRVFQQESGSTQTLNYEIMVPPADAVAPPGGFPLVFTTYGRGRLADAMALDAFRDQYPAYVVSFIHSERPGPLHPPPVYVDFSFLFIELFEHLFDTYNIDTDRVYGSGWSRGGSSMTILSHAYASLSHTEPLITAAVPSAGGFQNMDDNLIESIRDVKWLSLQGANDGNSNPYGSLHAFDQLEKAGALDNIFWWVEDAGHSPHDFGWNVAEVVDWMFAQNKADLSLRPDAVMTVGVTEADAPLTFTADASGSTPNNGGSIVGYTWQLFKSQQAIADYSNRYLHGWTLDTGFQEAPVIGTGASVTETISEPGTWWLRVIVEDSDGNRAAATQEFQVRSVVPTADFSFSRNHEKAGEPVAFDAAGSVAEYGADLSSYAWDFGDGSSATGVQVAHSYATAGTYTVELTVTSTEGESRSVSKDLTVTSQFPGYRYFRFTGLDMIETYRNPEIQELAFRVGSVTVPRQPMTSNSSQGIALEASWGDTPYRAFDQDPETAWTAHNYFTPGILELDMGEAQRFVPTGVEITLANNRGRWTLFHLEASVDEQHWDRLWTYDLAVDGSLDTEGETILFDDVPFVEVSNVDDGGVYGLGTELALQATPFNLDNVTQVNYFANDSLIGSSSAGAPFELLWEPSMMGEYELTVEAIFGGGDSTASPFPVVITINEAPALDHIDVTPSDVALYPGSTKAYQAESFSQFGNLLDPQPAITWSVPADAGTIDSNGTFTASSAFGTYAVLAEATYEGVTLSESIPVTVANPLDFCEEHFAGTELREVWEFIRKEDWAGSSAAVNDGLLTLQSRGESMWQDTQKFSAIRRDDITGDFDVSVKVVSQNQNYTDDASKLGILVANDFDELSQGGYLSLHTRGNGRVLFQREGTLGEISNSTSTDFPGGADWPVWLRLVKAGTGFTAYYKFAEADAWQELGTSTVGAAATDSEVALFASSNNTSETLFGVLTDFMIADCVPDLGAPPSIEQQPQGATINVNDPASLTVVASSDEPISYQWQKDGVDIAGATAATFSIANAGVSDSGSYRVAVSNINGTSLSAEAELMVNGTVPTVSAWPSASDLEFGQTLADSALNGGEANTPGSFSFANPSIIPEAGSSDQTVVFTPDDGFVYETVSNVVSVTVNPAAAAVSLSELTATYSGQAQSPTVTTDPVGLEVTITYDGTSTAPTDAGTYAVQVTVSDPNASGSASGTFTIDAAPLIVRADDTGKFEGDPEPALTWTVTGGELFGSDSLSGSMVRESGEGIGSYAITQGSLAASANYDFSFQAGTFTILEASDAPWVLQADFEPLALGNLHGQDGWSGTDSSAAEVVVDPLDNANQAFRFAPNNNDEIAKAFSTAMEIGEMATLFYRVYVPAGGSRINQQIRFIDSNDNYPLRIKWDNDPSEALLWLFDVGMGGSSKTQVDQTLSRDTWYAFWIVVDNINGRYHLYVEGGEYDAQTLITSSNMVDATGAHPLSPSGLETFRFKGWDNAPMLYDDLYLAHGGENLSNPVAPALPETSFASWMDQFSGLTEAEKDPTADPAGDGVANALKYAFGLNPTESAAGKRASATTAGLPVLHEKDVGASHVPIALRYRRDTSLNGVIYTPQWSADLGAGSWRTDSLVESILATDGDVEWVEVDFAGTTPIEKLFMRVEIGLQP